MSTLTPAEEIELGEPPLLEMVRAIRHRPIMYLGTLDLRGIYALVENLVESSLQEFTLGYASSVQVIIHDNNSITCADNGRGIPVQPIALEGNRSTIEILIIEGYDFSVSESGYRGATVGLHPPNCFCMANALSAWLRAEVRREGEIWVMDFRRGEINRPLQQTGVCETSGTTISFQPDPLIFPETDIDYDQLRQRLEEQSRQHPGVNLILIDERTDKRVEFCEPPAA